VTILKILRHYMSFYGNGFFITICNHYISQHLFENRFRKSLGSMVTVFKFYVTKK